MPEADGHRTLRSWRIWRWPLHWQILLALLIGSAAGISLGVSAIEQAGIKAPPDQIAPLAQQSLRQSPIWITLQLIGELFFRSLKVIVVPLVVSSLALAVEGLGETRDVGRLSAKTIAYYLGTTLLAILIGLCLVNIVRPGHNAQGQGILVGQTLPAFGQGQSSVETQLSKRTAIDFIRELVPPNLIHAAAEDELLSLIIVSSVLGFFLSRLPDAQRLPTVNILRAVYGISLLAAGLVLRFAPLGVLGLLAATFAEQYAILAPDARFESFLTGIGLFASVSFAALCIYMLIFLPIVLRLLAGIHPLRVYRAMAPALATAFSTASSSATLPLTLSCAEKRAGVSSRLAGFTIPLGASINMVGTALYECVAAIFICQAFGIELTFAHQFLIVIAAQLTSIGVAGIPAASLVAIVVILNAVQSQLPAGSPSLVAGLGMLFVIDRPLDMCRTTVNVFSDACGAVVIACSEGEKPCEAPLQGAR